MPTNKYKVQRSDVPTLDTGHSYTCPLLPKGQQSFPYQRLNRDSQQEALEKARDAGAAIMDANDQRAGRKLSIREHYQMLENKLGPDPRSTMQKVLEDAEIRSNTDTTEDELNGTATAIAADLNNDKLYNTPARRAIREKMKQEIQAKYDARQNEIGEQQAQAERESNPRFRGAEEHGQASLRLAMADAELEDREQKIVELRERLQLLSSGQISVDEYWAAVKGVEPQEPQQLQVDDAMFRDAAIRRYGNALKSINPNLTDGEIQRMYEQQEANDAV